MNPENSEFAVIEILFWVYSERNQRVFTGMFFLVINDNKLS